MTPKITRRAAVQSTLGATVTIATGMALGAVASDLTPEPESDVRPVLPFSEEAARWLLGPLVPTPKGD